MKGGGQGPARISVVVPMYNCESYLVEMAQRLFLDGLRRSCPQGTELVLIDDASPLEAPTRALAEAASSWVPVTYHRNARNLGFVRSLNEGLRRARGGLILSVNSDIRFTPGSIERLASAVLSAPDIGMAGPVTNNAFAAKLQSVDGCAPLGSFSDGEFARIERFAGSAARGVGGLIAARWLMGFCIMMRRELLDGVGLLDERFGLGYLEEMDYALRCRRAGWRIVVDPGTFVFHGGLKRSWAADPRAGSQTMRTRPWSTIWHLARNIAYSIWKNGWEGYSAPQNLD